ncbi:hypothetical protein DFJ63DRAFT_114854 [Scheffersomyces coipomensis]|uniref:uncharacterized protein n=1 Tax=Scheffersomyces coipomensis TaxID=1788519 RepID=UPI00315D68AA
MFKVSLWLNQAIYFMMMMLWMAEGSISTDSSSPSLYCPEQDSIHMVFSSLVTFLEMNETNHPTATEKFDGFPSTYTFNFTLNPFYYGFFGIAANESDIIHKYHDHFVIIGEEMVQVIRVNQLSSFVNGIRDTFTVRTSSMEKFRERLFSPFTDILITNDGDSYHAYGGNDDLSTLVRHIIQHKSPVSLERFTYDNSDHVNVISMDLIFTNEDSTKWRNKPYYKEEKLKSPLQKTFHRSNLQSFLYNTSFYYDRACNFTSAWGLHRGLQGLHDMDKCSCGSDIKNEFLIDMKIVDPESEPVLRDGQASTTPWNRFIVKTLDK